MTELQPAECDAMKAFVSSTFVDLAEHRRVAAEALHRLGLNVGRMELFGAQPGDATSVSLAEVKACSLFVGVYAHRYGYIPSGSSSSVTEQEFDYARSLGLPVLCFLVNDDYPWRPKWVDGDPNRSRLTAFKTRINELYVRDTFTSPDDLGLKVATAAGRHLNAAAAAELASQTEMRLRRAGIGPEQMATGQGLKGFAGGERDELLGALDELRHRVDQLLGEKTSATPPVDPSSLRALANGLVTAGKWREAAVAFEEYAAKVPDDWESNFLRGVAHANTRGGRETDLRALRAMNDTITFAPADVDQNRRSRLFTYRAAMCKRLGRYEEALSDLAISERYATKTYEVEDTLYNLACVHALRGDRPPMLAAIQKLKDRNSAQLSAVRAHLHDYFARFDKDDEFLSLIGHISHP